MSSVEVTFNKSKWIDCDSFENSLIEEAFDMDKVNSVTFVFPENCHLLLEPLARLLAICNQLVSKKKQVTLFFLAPDSLLSYLNRIGFLDHLNKEVKVLPQRPEDSTAKSHKGSSCNIVELGEVDPNKENIELVKQLRERFVALSSEDYDLAAHTIFAELIGNIKEHSRSQLKGFAGLQKYEGKRHHIQTVVSDSGLGIAATLRPSLKVHYPHLYKLYKNKDIESDITLVKEVISEGNISRHGAGRGLGFRSSQDHASKFDARFSIRQESFNLDFHFENDTLTEITEQTDLVKILGTHICFDFYIG